MKVYGNLKQEMIIGRQFSIDLENELSLVNGKKQHRKTLFCQFYKIINLKKK
jgi:hypothetical protein